MSRADPTSFIYQIARLVLEMFFTTDGWNRFDEAEQHRATLRMVAALEVIGQAQREAKAQTEDATAGPSE